MWVNCEKRIVERCVFVVKVKVGVVVKGGDVFGKVEV